jgi:hypothetical protein
VSKTRGECGRTHTSCGHPVSHPAAAGDHLVTMSSTTVLPANGGNVLREVKSRVCVRAVFLSAVAVFTASSACGGKKTINGLAPAVQDGSAGAGGSGGFQGDASAGQVGGATGGGGIGPGTVASSGGFAGSAGGGPGGSGAAGTGAGGSSTGGTTATAPKDAGPGIDAPPACAQATTLEACALRPDCHAVYVDPGTCDCAALGCCTRFDHCAAGASAYCNGSVDCEMKTPNCEGPYVVSYSAATNCYEGCVLQKECYSFETPCPSTKPTAGSPCLGQGQCTYQDCAGSGRSIYDCKGLVWSETLTMACAATLCDAVSPSGRNTLVCDPGKICVVTWSSGGAYGATPACVTNTCSPSPLSPTCLSGTSGTCTVTAANVVECRPRSTCGPSQGGCQ